MKRFKIPKIEETDSDYKLWGLTIPKLQNGNVPHINRRDKSRRSVPDKDDSVKPKVIHNRPTISEPDQSDVGSDQLDINQRTPAAEISTKRDNSAKETSADDNTLQSNGQTEHFSDIVFSFFSSTDQRYVVHRPESEYSDIDQTSHERRKSGMDSGNEYEIMNATPKLLSYTNASELNTAENGKHNNNNMKSSKLHKSELTFYVSATSLKDSDESGKDVENNYDLPAIHGHRDVNKSIYTTHNKSLNDLTVTETVNEAPKYQNSASLDNLSQVCNISLKNSDSKRSIASLPELDTFNKKARDFLHNPFMFPKLSITPKSSVRSEYSSYFDNNQRATRLKNRISALYSAHKGFKGKKRLSKAWFGIKEWFEMERTKMDKVIHKHSPRKFTKSSGDDYPDSEFSDYEDVADGSVDSFGKDEVFSVNSDATSKSKKFNLSDETKLKRKGVKSLSGCNSEGKLNDDGEAIYENGMVIGVSLRHSRSQPSVRDISGPVLVKINCEDVDQCADNSFGYSPEDSDFLTVASISPDCESTKSECGEANADSQLDATISNDEDRFAVLRIIVKEGSVMCKELLNILQQRAEVERQYCCGVLRVGARARRAAKGVSGVALASRRTALDLESRAQIHRQFSNRLVEEVVRPLQRLVTTRDSVRKQVEHDVGRTARRLSELRELEARTKKASFATARSNERLQDTSVTKGNTPTQEAELRRKKAKSEEAASKADVDYYMSCVRAERARVEWETAVAKGLEALVELEEERLTSMRKSLRSYVNLTTLLGPGASSEESLVLESSLESALSGERRVARRLLKAPPAAMRLPDFYSQHTTLAMNKERRRQALVRILDLIKNDMERERKSKQALEKLSAAITTTPNFGGNDSQQNVSEKIYHMRSLLTYLEGARVQASGALAVLAGKPRPPHPLAPHVKVCRDRRGLERTTLLVPLWLQQEYKVTSRRSVGGDDEIPGSPPSSPGLWSDRGAADGVSIQHYSDIEDSHFDQPPARPPPPKLPPLDIPQPYCPVQAS